MVAITGYTFQAGNHEVYLLDPLRRAGLASFAGDPFVHETLQYHGLFSVVSAWLYRMNVAAAGFLAAFSVLLIGLAWSWWRIVHALGGGVTAYLISVLLYHVLVGDRALGMYSLLQDGQFNAGNVAAVGLVAGIAMLLERRLVPAGLAFGLAGAFHLNYAVICPVIWLAVAVPTVWRNRDVARRGWLIATILALLPAAVNIGLALPAKLWGPAGAALPFDRFVELYVELRHPHHYRPGVWPWWLWVAFVLPVPMAVRVWWRHRRQTTWRTAGGIWLLLIGLQVVALVTAGLFYVSETAIQMSLWRFSPHAKLLMLAAVGVWLEPGTRLPRFVLPTSTLLLVAVVWTGPVIAELRGVDASRQALLEAADWARTSTERDALFLVPPGVGSGWAVHSRRGHVVSFKLVPQLSSELGGWADRLTDVLDVDDLARFEGGFAGYMTAQRDMDARYHALPFDHLADVARRHDARFVLAMSDLEGAPAAVWRGERGAVIYRVEPAAPTTRPVADSLRSR
jgi:hypothetical protein